MKKYVLLLACGFWGSVLNACQGNCWESPTIKGDNINMKLIPHPEEWNVLAQSYLYPHYMPLHQHEVKQENSGIPSAEQVCPLKILNKSGE